MTDWTNIKTYGDFIFAFAYPLSFFGSAMYGVAMLLQIDITSIVANKTVSTIMNALIGVAGFLAFMTWFNTEAPIVNLITNKGVNDLPKANVSA